MWVYMLAWGLGGIGAMVAAGLLHVRRKKRAWVLFNVKGDFTAEHHLPEEIPVPREELERVRRGEFSFDEAVQWMRRFVRRCRRHRLRGEYERVLSKYDVYRELSEKMGRGLWKDVLALGQQLAELDPRDPSAAIARGRAMRELGNFPGALKCYQQALDMVPFHSTALPEMAATCRAVGQTGRFRATLERARQELGETHPLTIEARIQLGELVRVYADPTDPATLAHIPREQYIQNMSERIEQLSLEPEGFLEVGEHMLSDAMPELAEHVAQRCQREYGRCAQWYLLRGMIERHQVRYAAAERMVRRSIRLDDCSAARLELGRILTERANHEDEGLMHQAREQLRLAIDRDPASVDAVAMLVEPAWKEGLDGVVAELNPLLKAYPNSWAVWRVLGDAYAAEGKVAEAIESYRRGLECDQTDELLLPYLDVLERAGQRKEMLAIVRRVDDLTSRDGQLRWKAAQVLCEHQRLDDARRVLSALVDDEYVPPPLRQRADDVLDHLDEIERKQQGVRRVAQRQRKPRGDEAARD